MIHTTSNKTMYKGSGKHTCNLHHWLVGPRYKQDEQVNKKNYKQPNEKMGKR